MNELVSAVETSEFHLAHAVSAPKSRFLERVESFPSRALTVEMAKVCNHGIGQDPTRGSSGGGALRLGKCYHRLGCEANNSNPSDCEKVKQRKHSPDMKLSLRYCCVFVIYQTILVVSFCFPAHAEENGWLDLTDPTEPQTLSLAMAWQDDHSDWTVAGEAGLDPAKPRALSARPGQGVLISSLTGHFEFRNLTSRQFFRDLEVHVEFLIPKGSNAGVKLQGLYEIQIRDSHGTKQPTASDCGGVYPRAELLPRYHTTDLGVPPRTNAALPAGQWQTLDIRFQAPRFDTEGKKTANARFLKVVLNGQVIHENVELKWPTGHAWRTKPEVPRGPLFLQGDHGPVAYRNVRVRIPELP